MRLLATVRSALDHSAYRLSVPCVAKVFRQPIHSDRAQHTGEFGFNEEKSLILLARVELVSNDSWVPDRIDQALSGGQPITKARLHKVRFHLGQNMERAIYCGTLSALCGFRSEEHTSEL